MRREAEVARAEWAESSAFTPEAFTGRRLDAFVAAPGPRPVRSSS
ncbi:hypothetical protein ACFY9C_32780 [Streptomyces filamentosus]